MSTLTRPGEGTIENAKAVEPRLQRAHNAMPSGRGHGNISIFTSFTSSSTHWSPHLCSVPRGDQPSRSHLPLLE